jgi:hypothetical protein
LNVLEQISRLRLLLDENGECTDARKIQNTKCVLKKQKLKQPKTNKIKMIAMIRISQRALPSTISLCAILVAAMALFNSNGLMRRVTQ